MAATWEQLTAYLRGLDLPVGSRIALPVDYLTRVVGEWPEKANTPTYWAVDMSNPPARFAWQAGYMFGGFDFVQGGMVPSRVQLEKVR
jgi:hypothetical protein